jgi:RimJ/RimL family protein N-acetyltransferase
MTWDMQVMKDVVLENDVVRLRRINLNDKAGFAKIAFDPETWEHFVSMVSTEQELDNLLEEAIRDTLSGSRMAFAIVDRASGEVAGSTSYGNLFPKERKLEIGWSWLGRQYRGTGINRATKALLLEYAFDTLGCERVEFKTDILNLRARRGLSAIGATEEGTLRSFNYMPGGRRRNAVFYSILKHEWAELKKARAHGSAA